MTRITTDNVAEMTPEQKDEFIVSINDERIRENSILSTKMGEIEGDIADQLKVITDTSWRHSLSNPLSSSDRWVS